MLMGCRYYWQAAPEVSSQNIFLHILLQGMKPRTSKSGRYGCSRPYTVSGFQKAEYFCWVSSRVLPDKVPPLAHNHCYLIQKARVCCFGDVQASPQKFSQPLAGIPGSRYRCLYLRFHLESLNTLKYTVIIAHVTQSPRREEKNNLWCRRFRLQLIGMITG